MIPGYTFVINPYAARGRNRRLRRLLERELGRRGVPHDIVETCAQGDGTRLAREATTKTVVAVGGDGTIQEVANGIMGSEKVLGIIPAGSGNDFIKGAGIPGDFARALHIILSGETTTVDVGRISVRSSATVSSRYFVNGVGIGFDAEVAARTQSIRFVGGFGLYLLAVLRTLGSYSAPDFRILVDGEELVGPRLLVAIGNGPCAAGRFYLTPRAGIADGLLDICAIRNMGIPSILRLMPRVLKGSHLSLESVRYIQARVIEVAADRPFSVHADGEVLGRQVRQASVEVMARALRVATGRLRDGEETREAGSKG